MFGEQVGKDRRRGERVLQGVVRAIERHAVAGADVAEAVRQRAIGIELARQSQRAEPGIETQRDVFARAPRAR